MTEAGTPEAFDHFPRQLVRWLVIAGVVTVLAVIAVVVVDRATRPNGVIEVEPVYEIGDITIGTKDTDGDVYRSTVDENGVVVVNPGDTVPILLPACALADGVVSNFSRSWLADDAEVGDLDSLLISEPSQAARAVTPQAGECLIVGAQIPIPDKVLERNGPDTVWVLQGVSTPVRPEGAPSFAVSAPFRITDEPPAAVDVVTGQVASALFDLAATYDLPLPN